jgi:Ca-activated chloride channel family protein
MGEAFIVTKPAEAQVIANKFRKYISSPVLTGITYNFNGFETYDVEPQAIPDVLAERPVMLFGKWRGKAKGQIEISGYSGGGKKFFKRINVSDYEPSDKNVALKFLWARHRIAMLADYNQLDPNDERVNQITNLGLSYNLLTDYTSFLAVDSEIRSQGKQITKIHQPLPLPQGVSNFAVGAASGGFGWKKSKGWAPVKHSVAQDRTVNEEAELTEIKTTVELEKVIADGEQMEKNIRGVVILKITDLELCYQRSSSFGMSGKIMVKIVMNKKGDIANVFISSDDMSDKNLERCLIAKIKTWQLLSKSEEFKDISFSCEFKFSTN